TGVVYHYLYDANGNVGQLVNAGDGSTAAHYDYDPYGNEIVADGPEAVNNIYRFSTKYYDAETELYYYGYRYYSPKLGRWISRDPIGEKGGVCLYIYCGNNSVIRVDLLGADWAGAGGEWWNLNGYEYLSSASELADLFDQNYYETVEFLNHATENNPSCYMWIVAASLKTAMDLGRGTS
ncbi:MAG: RHS repeat-associated core domain-containing protein, partial [Desulfobacteraceae bacterium]|nr:RHS repeat-associated core domain-containing protein [Desulfobacteraceae bacterium]